MAKVELGSRVWMPMPYPSGLPVLLLEPGTREERMVWLAWDCFGQGFSFPCEVWPFPS